MNEISIDYVVSKNIKMLRKKLGWSQEQLAEKTGVSAPYIAQIEVTKRTPSLDIVEKLANAFGVEYKVLFEINNPIETIDKYEFSNHLLELKLIDAVTETIKKQFNS